MKRLSPLFCCVYFFILFTLFQEFKGCPQEYHHDQQANQTEVDCFRKSESLFSALKENITLVSETRKQFSPESQEPSFTDVCQTDECKFAASQMKKYMDEKVEPCDDFYKFACGNFLKSRTISEDDVAVNIFGDIREKIDRQLKTILERKKESNDSLLLHFYQNVYNLCMNRTTIEEKSLTEFLNYLKLSGGWPVLEGDSWQEKPKHKIVKLGSNFSFFFNLDVTFDLKNETKRVIQIDQPSFDLSREELLSNFSDKIITAYYSYMVDIATILGADKTRAETELLESLKFERQLANISSPEEKRKNITTLYNSMKLEDLQKNYPIILWKKHIQEMLKFKVDDNEIINLSVPTYLKNLKSLLHHVSNRTLANFVEWRMIFANLKKFVTTDLQKRRMQFFAVRTGQIKSAPRWKECLNNLKNQGLAILYVKTYVNAESKKNVVELVNNIKQEFTKTLQTAEWMDDKTRKNALEKIEAMNSYISYSDKPERKKFTGLFKTRLFYTDNTYKEPVNKTDWMTNYLSPITVNAQYNFQTNSINLPAGILQEHFFNDTRPQYLNFGGLGWIIAHEIAHVFSEKGIQLDKKGTLNETWEPETKEKFLKNTMCLINQYENYTAEEVELKVNGIKTLDENFADNAGLKESYWAYKDWVKKNGPELLLPGLNYSPSQLFWIHTAQNWCEKRRPEAQNLMLMSGEHAPPELRILGSFSNRPEFSEDFKCRIGSRMNPEKKCSVW